MKYNQPFDQPSTPNASYVNGNPSTGTPGSIPPAAAFESPQRELIALITGANFTPSDGDLTQVGRALQSNALRFGLDTGSVNSFVVTLVPVPLTLTIGIMVCFKVAHANTGPTLFNLNSLGGKAVVHFDGSACRGGEFLLGALSVLMYDGTNWQIINDFLGPGIGGVIYDRSFSVQKGSDQAISQGVQTDVTWNAATSTFGTFNGTTFTWNRAGTYILMSGLWIAGILSNVDYLHTGGNFIYNGGSLHGFGDNQSFATGAGGATVVNFGHAVVPIAVNDTLKITGSSAATTYWTSGAIRASGETFLDITRIG